MQKKTIPILLTLGVILIVAYLFISAPDEQGPVVAPPTETVTTPEPLPTPEEYVPSDLEVKQAPPGGDSPLGTDLNMEFPTLDELPAPSKESTSTE